VDEHVCPRHARRALGGRGVAAHELHVGALVARVERAARVLARARVLDEPRDDARRVMMCKIYVCKIYVQRPRACGARAWHNIYNMCDGAATRQRAARVFLGIFCTLQTSTTRRTHFSEMSMPVSATRSGGGGRHAPPRPRAGAPPPRPANKPAATSSTTATQRTARTHTVFTPHAHDGDRATQPQ
jgi:hypothetical protein